MINLSRSANNSDNSFASYKVPSTGPERSLETKFSKKGYLQGRKKTFAYISRFLGHEKSQGTICECPQGLPTFTVEAITSFFQDPGF